jgi:hypothetical protein
MKELEKKIKTTKNIKLIIKIQSIYRGIHNREKLEKKFKIPKKKKKKKKKTKKNPKKKKEKKKKVKKRKKKT